MSITWTDACTVQLHGVPPSEPYGYWAECSCGLRSSMVRSPREARVRLGLIHRRRKDDK